DGWRLNSVPRIRLATDGDERMVDVPVEPATRSHVVADDVVHVDVDGRSIPFRIAPPPDVDRSARVAAAHGQAGAAELSAPMPGSVQAVHAHVGDELEVGDPVVTLEAMKMEHVVAATVAGRLTELGVQPGDQVVRGEVLGSIEPTG
ncbi:MAG TPA: biotin/lipoyl-containing protein, partial [Candidatus Limnocylindrales bacterium]